MKIEASNEEVQQIFEHYKSSTQLDESSGALKVGDIDIMWARVALCYNLQIEMEALVGEAAYELMRSISYGHGKNFFPVAKRYLIQRGHKPTEENMLRILCMETPAIGWGRIYIEKEDGRYIIVAENGLPVGRAAIRDKRKFDHGVDSYYLGYFLGYISQMVGRNLRGSEVECVAKGDDCCRMVIEG